MSRPRAPRVARPFHASDWEAALVCFPTQILDSEPLIVPVHSVDSHHRQAAGYPTAHDDPSPEDHKIPKRHAACPTTKAQNDCLHDNIDGKAERFRPAL